MTDTKSWKKQQSFFKVKDAWFEEEQFKGRISKSHPKNDDWSLFF